MPVPSTKGFSFNPKALYSFPRSRQGHPKGNFRLNKNKGNTGFLNFFPSSIQQWNKTQWRRREDFSLWFWLFPWAELLQRKAGSRSPRGLGVEKSALLGCSADQSLLQSSPRCCRNVTATRIHLGSLLLSLVELICGFQEKVLEKRVVSGTRARLARFGWLSLFYTPAAAGLLVSLL